MGVFHVFQIVQMVPNRAKQKMKSRCDQLLDWILIHEINTSKTNVPHHDRNQQTDLYLKSIDCFLYDGNIGR